MTEGRGSSHLREGGEAAGQRVDVGGLEELGEHLITLLLVGLDEKRIV